MPPSRRDFLANFSIHCRTILHVSKGWKRCLTSLPQLWMQIELGKRKPHTDISGHAVQKYIKWSKNKLRHVVVKDLSVDAVHQTLAMLSKCSELEHLEFWGDFDCENFYNLFKDLKKLRTLLTSSQVSQQYIAKFFEALPQLERVQFFRTTRSESKAVRWPKNLPNLKHLSFDCHDQDMEYDLQRVPGFHIPVTFVNRTRKANYVSSPLFVRLLTIPQTKKKKKKKIEYQYEESLYFC